MKLRDRYTRAQTCRARVVADAGSCCPLQQAIYAAIGIMATLERSPYIMRHELLVHRR